MYLEKLTNLKFPKGSKTNTPFMKGLKFDGYNSELNLAIEYNGEQHYRYVPYFHKNGTVDFKKQQDNDVLKNQLCQENNIYLITVPYWIFNKEKYIEDEYNNYLFLTSFA